MFKIEKTKIKKGLKKITIFIVVFAWLFSGWPPISNYPRIPEEIKESKAVVPAGIIVAWPGTAASIPAGWSRVTAFDTYFLQGTTADPSATAGGSATHTHTSPTHDHTIAHTHTVPATGAPSGTVSTGNSNSLGARNNHTHDSSNTDPASGSNNSASANLGTASNLPPYTEVIWIKSNGTTDIPSLALAYYDSDSLPASWARTSLNRFLKGATAGGNGGATGGTSDVHTHIDSGHTHTENVHTHTGTKPASARTRAGSGASGTAAAAGHTHQLSGGNTTATETSGVGVLANGDAQPPFTKLNIIQNNTGGASLPTGSIAMWDTTVASIPTDWVLCDGTNGTPNLNNQFVKGTGGAGEVGTIGGALTHTHLAGTAHTHTINNHTHSFTVSATTNTVAPSGNGQVDSTATHTHANLTSGNSGGPTGSATITADANADNRPPYKEIVYIKYQPTARLTQTHTRWRNDDGVEAWYNSTWGYRKKITIDHTKVSGSGLTNFPVLINRTDTDWRDTGNGGHVGQTNGNDILFTGADGTTKLDHEIEKYVSSTGALQAWVKIPALSSVIDTDIYIYYGNASCANQENINGVWDSNYRMVMHLDETAQTVGSNNDHQDSTLNGNNGESTNGTNMNAGGNIDGADSFDNVDDYIACGTSNLPAIGGDVTLSTWAYYSTAPGTDNLILVDNNSSAAYQLGFRAGVPASWGWGGGVYVSSTAVSANAWHYYTYTYNGTTHRLYVDGVETNNSTLASQTGTPTVNSINTDRWGENFGGLIDETRISASVRSADWIATEYNNQFSPATFYSVGVESASVSANSATFTLNEDTLLNNYQKNTNIRVRFQVANTSATTGANAYRLQVSETATCSSGTYADVPTDTSGHWQISGSTYISDGEATLNIDPGLTDVADVFIPGQLKDSGNTTGTITLSTNQFTEIEYSIKALDASTSGGHYCFRLFNATSGSPLYTYSSYAEVNVVAGSQLNQSAYRFFANQDSTDVTTALAGQDSSATLTLANQPFRLRMLLHVSGSSLGVGESNFKLQYALKSGTCDTAFSGETYADVTGATPIAYYNNPTPADGNGVTANAVLDPSHSGHTTITQTYEEANDFTSVNSIADGQDGLWDFSLINNSAISRQAYCLRVVNAGGSALSAYTVVPEIISSPLFPAVGTYISSAYNTGTTTVFSVLEWDWSKSNPACATCDVKLQLETAPDAGGAPGAWNADWCGPTVCDGTEFYASSTGQMINTIHNGNQWVRYKASFYGDGVSTPILDEVRVYHDDQN